MSEHIDLLIAVPERGEGEIRARIRDLLYEHLSWSAAAVGRWRWVILLVEPGFAVVRLITNNEVEEIDLQRRLQKWQDHNPVQLAWVHYAPKTRSPRDELEDALRRDRTPTNETTAHVVDAIESLIRHEINKERILSVMDVPGGDDLTASAKYHALVERERGEM